MSRRKMYSNELKSKLVKEYLDGNLGIKALAANSKRKSTSIKLLESRYRRFIMKTRGDMDIVELRWSYIIVDIRSIIKPFSV